MMRTNRSAAVRSAGLATSLLLALGGCAGSSGSTVDAPCSECGPTVAPPAPEGLGLTDAPELDVTLSDEDALAASLAVGTIRVRPGAETTLEVRIERNDFHGEVAVWVEGLSEGLVAEPTVMPAAVPTGRLVIGATLGAALGGPHPFTVVVSAAGLDPIEVPARVVVAGAPGALDETFGDDGIAAYGEGGRFGVHAAAVDTKGRVLVAGRDFDAREMLLERLGADGRIDAVYGENARAILPDEEFSSGSLMVLDGDEARVLMSAGSSDAERVQVGLAAFDELGHPDVSLGDAGLVAANQVPVANRGSWSLVVGEGSVFFRVGDRLAALRPDRTVTDLSVPEGAVTSFAMAYWNHTLTFAASRNAGAAVAERIHTAGGRDARFADGGILHGSTPTAEDHASTQTLDLVLLEDGSGYAARSHLFADSSAFGELLRFTPDGRPDPTFGEGGTVSLESLGEVIWSLAMDSAGRPVLFTQDFDTFGRRIRRYTRSGQPDRTFGDDGVVDLGLLGLSQSRHIALDRSADRLVTCGGTHEGDGWQCARLWL